MLCLRRVRGAPHRAATCASCLCLRACAQEFTAAREANLAKQKAAAAEAAKAAAPAPAEAEGGKGEGEGGAAEAKTEGGGAAAEVKAEAAVPKEEGVKEEEGAEGAAGPAGPDAVIKTMRTEFCNLPSVTGLFAKTLYVQGLGQVG